MLNGYLVDANDSKTLMESGEGNRLITVSSASSLKEGL